MSPSASEADTFAGNENVSFVPEETFSSSYSSDGFPLSASSRSYQSFCLRQS